MGSTRDSEMDVVELDILEKRSSHGTESDICIPKQPSEIMHDLYHRAHVFTIVVENFEHNQRHLPLLSERATVGRNVADGALSVGIVYIMLGTRPRG